MSNTTKAEDKKLNQLRIKIWVSIGLIIVCFFFAGIWASREWMFASIGFMIFAMYNAWLAFTTQLKAREDLPMNENEARQQTTEKKISEKKESSFLENIVGMCVLIAGFYAWQHFSSNHGDKKDTRIDIEMGISKNDNFFDGQYIEILSKEPTPFTVQRILVNNRTGMQGCDIVPNKIMRQGDALKWSFPSSTCGIILSLAIETDKGKPNSWTWKE